MSAWRCVAALLTLSAPAHAACSASATGVAFGVYTPSAGSPADAAGSVTIACSLLSVSISYSIALSIGGGGSYAARRMSSGGSTLGYQLYQDAAHSQVWGDGTGGTTVVSAVALFPLTGGSTSYSVYGRIPAGQYANPGGYTDTIIVTITY